MKTDVKYENSHCLIDEDYDIEDIMSPKSIDLGVIDTSPILTKTELNRFDTNMSA